MLAYILAVLVGTGSVGLYLAAFFFPEIHRKHDFIWSGVGCFYALVLWIYARQETGGILLGQVTSVVLLGWFGWQTFKLRRQLVPVNQQTPIPNPTKIQAQLGLNRSVPKAPKPTSTTSAHQPINPLPPVSQTAPPAANKVSDPVRQARQPVTPTPAEPVDTDAAAAQEAWIKLEAKPAQTPSKPLGTAVKPPMTRSEPPQPAATIPEPISTNIPTDKIDTKAQLALDDLEDVNT
jgi:Ycf66 protein N-terminus